MIGEAGFIPPCLIFILPNIINSISVTLDSTLLRFAIQLSHSIIAQTMPNNRSGGRNVHIYNASTPGYPAIGGLCQKGMITKAMFFDMMAIIVATQPSSYTIFHRESASLLQKGPDLVQQGNYEIRSQGQSCNDAGAQDVLIHLKKQGSLSSPPKCWFYVVLPRNRLKPHLVSTSSEQMFVDGIRSVSWRDWEHNDWIGYLGWLSGSPCFPSGVQRLFHPEWISVSDYQQTQCRKGNQFLPERNSCE